MTEKEMEQVCKILEMTMQYNPICKDCKNYGYCMFAFECLSNDYLYFRNKKFSAKVIDIINYL
jgi:hypothetical protein